MATPKSPNHPSRKPIKTGRPERNSDSTQDNKPAGFPPPSKIVLPKKHLNDE